MKKKHFFLLVVVCIIAIFGLFLFLKRNELDIKSDQVKELYNYLGVVDEHQCGGLNVYKSDKTTIKDISMENRLCMAYYQEKETESGELKATGTNKNKVKICKKGDVTLAAEEDTCSYTTLSKENLNKEYKKLYGQDIEDYKNFYISGTKVCYLEGEEYICGNAETFTYSLSAPAAIYRQIDKAIKKDDEIIITDRFLKVSDNKCFKMNDNNELKDCSNAIKDTKEISSGFLKKYGSKFEHTFKLDSNGNYYWVKSVKK